MIGKIKIGIALLSIIPLLAGCLSAGQVKKDTATMHKEIEGHWEDDTGFQYYVSDHKIVMVSPYTKKVVPGASYTVESYDEINSTLNVKEVADGLDGSMHIEDQISFADDTHKELDIWQQQYEDDNNSKVGDYTKATWTYVDSKTQP